MRLIDRIMNLFKGRLGESRIYVPRRQAGVAVTEDSALAYSAVHSCVRLISETLASLPWHVYQRMANGRQSLPNHPVQWLLNVQPNPEMSAFEFRRLLMQKMLIWGNGLAEIERGNDGRAVWLWPLPTERVGIRRNPENKSIQYVIKPEGDKEYVLDRANVLHIADSGYDGIWGQSRIQLARRSIGIGIAQDAFAAAYYGNGASIGGVIENKGRTLTKEARELLLHEFNTKYQGPDRAHKTLYLDAGMEYKHLTLPLNDAQYLESRRFNIEEISRWYGVPPHLIQDLTQSNYAVSYEASKNFVEHTLRPLCVSMEQIANIQLFSQRVRGDIYSKINLGGLLRADPKTRAEYYRTMISTGVMSINEVRELEELNSIGEYGDEHYLQVNMTTIERIAEPEEESDAQEESDVENEGEDDGQEEARTEAEMPEQVSAQSESKNKIK